MFPCECDSEWEWRRGEGGGYIGRLEFGRDISRELYIGVKGARGG